MEIIFIGAGNLGTQLSLAFKRAGHHVSQIYSRTEEHATYLADKLGCEWTTSLDEVRTDAELYVLCVRDAALQQVAHELHASLTRRATSQTHSATPQTHREPLFVHTAGSMSVDVLPMPRTGVFYPMQTLSRHRDVSFRQIPIFVESRVEEELLLKLASEISERVYVLEGSRRKYLHVAAVFACNFANHMYDLSSRILQEHDIPFDVMLPLIDETARKVHDIPPRQAQTGPAVRYDTNVMDRHVGMLPDEKMKRIYQLLSESIHDKL